MIRGKQVLYLFIAICLFLAAYLFYVDKQRKESIVKYFDQPRVGDIYKIKSDDEEGESWVRYLKIKEIGEDYIEFKSSKFVSNASADYIMNHYDESSSLKLLMKDLKEIKDGKWKNWQKDNTSLIEIMRKNK